ncbi:hypothetical protein GCM10028778_22400 [Barrientosiimonas marina]|uniref:Metal ABC transporter substrate-binding protein n=1 Tax=Lentibacillus kimchii TaxID=1542911 RepID=A0ABW2UUN1_9BACI
MIIKNNKSVNYSAGSSNGDSGVDPDHEDVYKKNAEDYIGELEGIDQEYENKINDIPEEDRVFMASERAYQYLTERYGFKRRFYMGN